MTRIGFDPLAQAELLEAVARYDETAVDLGDALVEETSRVLEQLTSFPLSAPLWSGELRRRPLFRFPYSLIYLVEGDLVYVVAVLHQSRGPRYLAGRLGDHVESK